MAIRAASSWGAAFVLVLGALVGSAGCGESKTLPKSSPPAQGGCGDCGGEGGMLEPPASGAPSGGSGGAAGSAGVGGDPEAPPAPGPELTLRSLSISQTLEVPLMVAGRALPVASRAVPLIAEKRALVRAFVDLDSRFRPRPLLGALDIRAGGREHTVLSERPISQASTQDDLESTFVFELAPEDLTPDSVYRVRVLEVDTTPLARFPESGFAELGAEPLGPFRLAVVPYVVNGFAPRTGEAELSSLRRRLVALFPSRDVEITVAPPVTLGYTLDAEGEGWDDALDLIYDLRAKASPPGDTFYYGLLAPAATFDAYCPGGCILGYSVVADARSEDERGSIGVGIFPDGSGEDDADNTAAHELGHALGRDHAPCGIGDPSDTDPNWPEDAAHRNALIGAYGYDFELDRLIKPRPTKDVMSYCSPAWVSDYTYSAIHERLVAIAEQQSTLQSVQVARVLRVARIGRAGKTHWLPPRVKPGARLGVTAALLDAEQRVVATVPARFARVDHGGGGYVWLLDEQLSVPGAVSVDLRPFGGAVLAL